MKIAVIVCTFPPYKAGMGNAAFGQARQLVRLGNEVVVYTARYEKSQKKFETIEGVKVWRLTPIFKYGNGAFLPQIFGRLGKFDVVFLHYPFFGGAEVVWLWKLFNRKKNLVMQYHMDVVGKGWWGLFFRVYAKTFRPWIIKSADKVICSSFDYVRNSEARGLVDDKWVEVPFGVDREKSKIKSQKSKVESKVQSDTNKIILFVGGLDRAHYFKGVPVLIEAFSRVVHTNVYANDMRMGYANNLKLIIVGGGDMKDEYQRLVVEKNLDDKVEFAGRVSDEELAEYYRRAQVLVLPAVDRCEAFGMVLLEAMSFGVPVIASNLPGVRSVVSDGEDGFLVKPRDVDELAEKIKWILTHQEEAREMGVEGRCKVEEKYDWVKIGRRLENILRGH